MRVAVLLLGLDVLLSRGLLALVSEGACSSGVLAVWQHSGRIVSLCSSATAGISCSAVIPVLPPSAPCSLHQGHHSVEVCVSAGVWAVCALPGGRGGFTTEAVVQTCLLCWGLICCTG